MTTQFFKISLCTLFFSLSACKNSQESSLKKTIAGPLTNCPTANPHKLYRKLKSDSLNKFQHCYDYSSQYLIDNNLIMAKAQWLKYSQNKQASIDFLLDMTASGVNNKQVFIELAKYYYQHKNWQTALQYIDLAELEVNHQFRLQVEYHLGEFSQGSDLSLLPYIYNTKDIKQANVLQKASSFNLQRVSDGNVNTINGEPSITTSSDGENIWLSWTDSGEVLAEMPDYYYWDIESARSTDGGNSWTSFDMNTTPNQIDRFHFDPMSAYDETNQILYAGGMVKGFGPQWGPTADDAIFLYRWHLVDDTTFGPFKLYKPAPDKGWITTDSNGTLYLAHYQGIEVSTDLGESYTTAMKLNSYAPQPRVNNNDCLIITDDSYSLRCGENELVYQAKNFSSLSAAEITPGDYIPGTFRAPVFVQNAIAPNDDIYVVYTDLKNVNSNETTIYMNKSSDNGQTWSAPWKIAPNITGDQFIPWIEIDANGGIHMTYFDTRNTSQFDSSPTITLDLYYSYSSDNGLSWQETRVTPSSFTNPDLIWGDYFFTDYTAMSVTDDKVYLAFPWSSQADQMHMYFAQKNIGLADMIFESGFELN